MSASFLGEWRPDKEIGSFVIRGDNSISSTPNEIKADDLTERGSLPEQYPYHSGTLY